MRTPYFRKRSTKCPQSIHIKKKVRKSAVHKYRRHRLPETEFFVFRKPQSQKVVHLLCHAQLCTDQKNQNSNANDACSNSRRFSHVYSFSFGTLTQKNDSPNYLREKRPLL